MSLKRRTVLLGATGAGLAGRVAPVVIAVAALTTVITRQVRRSKRAGDL